MQYTYVRQHDATDCAAACLGMICAYYKKEMSIVKLRDFMGTDIKGTNLAGIQKCAEQLGFLTQAVRVDEEGFFSEYPLPAIANVITKEGLSHFVVLFKISKKNIVVGDPAKGISHIKTKEFFQSFTGILMMFQPGEHFKPERARKHRRFKAYFRLIYPQRKLFLQGMAVSVLMSLLGILNSAFYYIVYDKVLLLKKTEILSLVLGIFLGVLLLQTGVKFIRQWIMTKLSMRIDFPFMSAYFRHIYKLPMKFFAARKTGDIITRFSDAFTIKDIFTGILPVLLIDAGISLISGILLYHINSGLFFVILGVSGISGVFLLVFQKAYKNVKEEAMEQASIVTSHIVEGIQGIETIKGNAGENAELEDIEREYKTSLQIGYKESMISNVQSALLELISGGGNMILIYLGICQVMEGSSTLGSIMAFLTLSNWFMEPLERFVYLQLSIQEADISMKRIAEIMEYECEQNSSEKEYLELEEVQGDIEVKNITFRYGNRTPVLKNISFTIKPGKKVALVGASGSGKSTMAKLLLKYYEPEEGSIVINGREIGEYSNVSLRKAIGYVPQKIELFSKSIHDNIAISKEGSTRKEVEEAAKKAEAFSFISKFPRGFDTHLEEAGNGLSGGEKQRIALARAFLKKSNFYILDESTSNLDYAAEHDIFEKIQREFQHASMLLIAHRLSTIKTCDEILVMEEGRIAERGTHEQLMKKKGHYFKLWEIQEGK